MKPGVQEFVQTMARHGAIIMTPQQLSDSFTQWARSAALLERITEEECADLASAYLAGYMLGAAGEPADP